MAISEPYTQWRSVYQNGLHFSSAADIKLLDVDDFDMNRFDIDNFFVSNIMLRGYGLMEV